LYTMPSAEPGPPSLHDALPIYLPPAEEAARTEAWLYEGRERSGVDPHEILRAFTDRTDRVLALLDGFMPECAWLDDTETLTYLQDRKSTRLNSSHVKISYAVFC